MESKEIPTPELDKMETPELDKMMKVASVSQEIGQFIDWLHTQGMQICRVEAVGGYPEEQYEPLPGTTEALLADYFEIDLDTIETERRAVLDALRKYRPGRPGERHSHE